MTEEDAKGRAEQSRAAHRVPMDWDLVQAELRYIQLGAEKREEPAQVRDLPAWVIHFTDGLTWAELALEDATGQVVRVERSR
jgi:hypothetical protein